MKRLSKSRALKLVRSMFGPSARFCRVDVAGLEGIRLQVDGAVVMQTFEVRGDVFRRLVQGAIPFARWRARRSA